MKKIKLSRKGMKVLEDTITHWEEVANRFGTFVEYHAKSGKCPLCQTYYSLKLGCEMCPISMDGKRCTETDAPWHNFSAGARRMLEYLRNLKERSTTIRRK